MSLVARLVRALVHETDDAELRRWVSGLRGECGRGLRELARSDPTSPCAKQVGEWLEEHGEEAGDLLPSLLGVGVGGSGGGATMVNDYLAVMNSVATAAISCGRPVVLRGFFHCTDCLSYWHWDSGQLTSLNTFAKDDSGDLVKCGGTRPRIFMLDGPSTMDRVRELNLEIRRSPLKRLPRRLYAGRPEVHIVREFRVEFTPGDPDAEIPLGSPGIIEMVASLTVALDAQRMPAAELQKTVAAVTDGISSE